MLKGGLIGCGFFAVNHMHGWNMAQGADIVAICDRDPARLAAIGDAFGISALYSDAARMLAEQDLDFVDIATTVPSHRSLVELAATNGLHVICQKPLADTLEDARAMIAAVERAGKTFMVHENFRWQSPVRAVIEAVRGGAIGTPFFCRASFRSDYDVYANQPYLATDPRFIIQDLGIHILDVARALMGDVERIAATTARINPRIAGEDVATMLLTHHSGMTSVVDCSYASPRRPVTFPETVLEIDGSTGFLRLDTGYQLLIQNSAGEVRRDVSPPLLEWAERPWHNIQESVALIEQHFVDSVLSGQNVETSGRDNFETLKLVEAAYLSAETGSTIELSVL